MVDFGKRAVAIPPACQERLAPGPLPCYHAGRKAQGRTRDRKGEPGMLVSQIMAKMIAFSEGNIHDVDHLIRVWTYARTIGELENVSEETRLILETAAIVHETSPVRFAARSTAALTASIRKWKAGRWRGRFLREPG